MSVQAFMANMLLRWQFKRRSQGPIRVPAIRHMVNRMADRFVETRDRLKQDAQELAEQAESARDQLLRATELDVWQSYYDLQTSVSSVSSATNLVKSATESAAAAAARYKAGVGSLLDFITAQQDDTNARVAQIQSYLDWYSALSRLNFALGASDSDVLKARAKK